MQRRRKGQRIAFYSEYQCSALSTDAAIAFAHFVDEPVELECHQATMATASVGHRSRCLHSRMFAQKAIFRNHPQKLS